MSRERVETVVIGGGQAGLAVGYHLQQRRLPFVILDAHPRVGDAWRRRWDSLRLFTPARYDGLPGMPFPAHPATFPTKDAMADYLEAYAARFALPVRTGVRVERLTRTNGRFALTAGGAGYEATNVVIAMSTWQQPRLPVFARELDPAIRQLHAVEYRNPSQLRPGGVLVVGAGNSGCEIALEAVRDRHPTWLSGRHPGHLPFRIESLAARLVLLHLILGFFFNHVVTIRTPVGRAARRRFLAHGMPLIRIKPRDVTTAGVQRVPRVAGVRDGRPFLEDGAVPDVANVVWCTGFDGGLSTWIDLPGMNGGEPAHDRGVVRQEPGLFLVGHGFVYAMSSAMVQGVGRDAAYVARFIADRSRRTRAGA